MDGHKENANKTREEIFLERIKKWKEEKALKNKTTSVQSRKPLTKSDLLNQKKDENTGRRKSTLTMKQKLEQWKQTKKKNEEENLNPVNKKLTTRCRQVKSRLLDIPARLSAPPRRLTVTSSTTTDKTTLSTREVVNKPCKSIKPLTTISSGKPVLAVGPTSRISVGLKTSTTNSHRRSSFGHRRSSLARGRITKGVTCTNQLPGILKRKSCVPRLPSQSEHVDKVDPESHELIHVKFESHCNQNNEDVGSKTQRTPVPSQKCLRVKLSNWLATKGKTPSKFRHLMCFDAEMSSKKSEDASTKQSLTIDELSQQQVTMAKEENVDQELDTPFYCTTEQACEETKFSFEDQLDAMLTQCQMLVEEGCPVENILAWLQKIYDGIPTARKSTRFYLFKVAVLKPRGDLNRVLTTFEDAIRNSSQPADDLARAMTVTVMDMTEAMLKRNINTTKSVCDDHVFESTAVKYCVREVTPFKKRRTTLLSESEHSPAAYAIITPVRRSTRKSTPARPNRIIAAVENSTPAENKRLHLDEPRLYDSLADVPAEERTRLLFRPNEMMKTLLFNE